MKFRTPKHRYYWLNREGLDIMICGLCGKSRFMGMHSRQPITDLHPICFERGKIIIKYCCGLDINICRNFIDECLHSTSWILIYINACEQVNWTVCNLVSIYSFSEFSSWSKMSWQQRQSALKCLNVLKLYSTKYTFNLMKYKIVMVRKSML